MRGARMSTTDYAHVSTGELIQKFPSARVNLPAVTMPERSYLRSSLGEMADAIREGLSEAVLEAAKT